MHTYVKKGFLVFLLLISNLSFAQQYTFKGIVVDQSNNPISDAVVIITPTAKSALTNQSGTFEFKINAAEKYTISIKAINYDNFKKEYRFTSDTFLNFQLKENFIEHQEIIVTGTSKATEKKLTPTPIHTISIKSMLEQSSTNIIDAIAKVPGVNQVTTGPSISKPIIRGLGYNRIVTLQDGVRQEGQQWGDEHGIEIDEFHVQRVEVLKVPSSLNYGSDALAGVINIITEPISPKDQFSGTIISNYQSNNGLAALHSTLSYRNKDIMGGLYFTRKQAHDYKNQYDGYVCNSRFANTNFGAHVGVLKKWGFAKLFFTSFNQTLGLVEGERDEQSGAFIYPALVNSVDSFLTYKETDHKNYAFIIPKQQIQHKKISLNTQFNFANAARLSAIVAYQNNQRKEYASASEPDLADLHLTLHTLTANATYTLPAKHNWYWSFGWNAMYQKNKISGFDFLIPSYGITDNALFALFQKKQDRWFISGGARMDSRVMNTDALWLDTNYALSTNSSTHAYQQFANTSTWYKSLTGSLGFSYALIKDAYLKLNLANAFRAPNIAEFSANGVHEGTVRYEYGNSQLKPEKATQVDIGLDFKTKHVNIQAALFANRIDHFIYLKKLLSVTGQDSIPPLRNENNFTAFIHDQNLAHLYGAELYLDVHPHPIDQLHFELTTTYVRAIAKDQWGANFNLPQIPPFRSILASKYVWQFKNAYLSSAYVKAELDYNSQQNQFLFQNNTETYTPSFALTNVYAGVDFKLRNAKQSAKLICSGINIFDIAYQSNLSRLKYTARNNATDRNGVFNMGRNISFTFVYNF